MFNELDEKRIVQNYVEEMIKRIETLFPSKSKYVITSNAVALIRRYYLERNLLDTDPRILTASCIVLATKIGEVHAPRLLDRLKELNPERM